MPLNHTSEFINKGDNHEEIYNWIKVILQNYINLGDRFELKLTRTQSAPEVKINTDPGWLERKKQEFIKEMNEKYKNVKISNEVLDVKVDWNKELPDVKVAWKDVDELIKERENESKST